MPFYLSKFQTHIQVPGQGAIQLNLSPHKNGIVFVRYTPTCDQKDSNYDYTGNVSRHSYNNSGRNRQHLSAEVSFLGAQSTPERAFGNCRTYSVQDMLRQGIGLIWTFWNAPVKMDLVFVSVYKDFGIRLETR